MRAASPVIIGLIALTSAAAALVPASATASPTSDSAAAAATRAAIVNSGKDDGVVTDLAGGWDRCPNGYICLFDGADGGGIFAFFKSGSPNLGRQNLDKAVSSQWNRSPWHFALYEGYNYSGRHNGTEPPGSRFNFGYWNGDNFYSSIRRA